MRLGIFAKTFIRENLEEILDAILAHGLIEVQFNLSCSGLPTLPEAISDATIRRIRSAFEARKLAMAAISGTFNMIHPDVEERLLGLDRLEVLVAAAPALGTKIITLCTGTRDPQNMWRFHPENASEAAWNDLLISVERLLPTAETHGVILGVEPELSNVVNTAARARALLDHFASPHLKVVIDAANLFPEGSLGRMHEILDEAFELLGPDIVLAHAKDLSGDGDAGHQAAGSGVLDYPYYLACLRRAGFAGPLILHSLSEPHVPGSIQFLKATLEAQAPGPAQTSP